MFLVWHAVCLWFCDFVGIRVSQNCSEADKKVAACYKRDTVTRSVTCYCNVMSACGTCCAECILDVVCDGMFYRIVTELTFHTVELWVKCVGLCSCDRSWVAVKQVMKLIVNHLLLLLLLLLMVCLCSNPTMTNNKIYSFYKSCWLILRYLICSAVTNVHFVMVCEGFLV